ncbi:hypothetical protein HJG54_15015 [Leptolyngbya sp. NK1-12]|uniref:Conjugal transfer protein TrbI n=1 Tax=Leptolyngbya sp. NK1-12 TaxID=2547451 RepID=A0AA96WFB9_9CYAN|nr:hypothetical protein [Leptolyngbya sp. NK1-12]WNZ24040.1 hypothetical protein HJG54_15015 [Leptolyngbya sp. NK1-12]
MKLTPRWQSSTALALALAMTGSVLAPLGWARSVAAADTNRIAQVFPPEWRNNLPPRSTPGRVPDSWGYRSIIRAGTIIPTSYERDKIVVTPTETAELTLTVASDIRSAGGTVLIPAGSEINGELRPTSGGTQFVAEELVLDNGERYPIEATSDVITRRETITRRSDPEIFQGVAIGAVAASILGEIFGNVELWQVLGGAGVGALGSLLIRNRERVEVIVVDPATDLDLQLESDFVLNPRSVQY